MKKELFIWLVIDIVLFLLPLDLSAYIYSYIDGKGVIHFSNVPVNPRFRLFSPETSDIIDYENEAHKLEPHIQDASQKYKVDPALIRAVIKVESNFNPQAISPSGALGLMQLMPETAEKMGVKDVFDPEQNIIGGTKYLKYLLTIFNEDLFLSLSAYNAGENIVKKYMTIPPYEQTKNFVKKVLKNFKKYKQKE